MFRKRNTRSGINSVAKKIKKRILVRFGVKSKDW